LESKFAQAMQLNAQLQAQLRNQPREPIAEFSAPLTSQNETERKLFEIQRLNNNVTLNPLRLRGFQDVKDSKENFLSQNINENSKARPEETLLMEKLKKNEERYQSALKLEVQRYYVLSQKLDETLTKLSEKEIECNRLYLKMRKVEEEMKRIHHRHHRDLEAKAQENLFIRQELEEITRTLSKLLRQSH